METRLYVIIVTPRNEDDPQVVTNLTLGGNVIFCGGSHFMDRARFFKSYDAAESFNIKIVRPSIDTRVYASFVRSCDVSLIW